ncbi:uncharacterized protein K441DRAFT_570836, partial [Cenococcum geophilum 1.58]|uniref:uncharacterized protein n=1 Tax=Cenococcum geophilum 1.58 TaxID=794803 RepID=UPI00358E1653
KYLDKNLSKGFIKASLSPIAVPVIFIKPSGDRTIRLYIDYRGLNKITIKNRYLLLLISKMLDKLFRVKIFIKLDL